MAAPISDGNNLPAVAPRARGHWAYDRASSALRYRGGKRTHQADEYMAQIAAERIVEHLVRARFVVMKRGPESGGAALGRGHEGQ
jgi:hypothetical protein